MGVILAIMCTKNQSLDHETVLTLLQISLLVPGQNALRAQRVCQQPLSLYGPALLNITKLHDN